MTRQLQGTTEKIHAQQRDFLQSEKWRNFQKNFGRSVYSVQEGAANFSIIEHRLPIIGKYFYLPYGPSGDFSAEDLKGGFEKMIVLAKKEKAGWIRFEPETELTLTRLEASFSNYPIKKAPKDVQPREIFLLDLNGKPEELLRSMHSKTRYNLKLARKKGVEVKKIFWNQSSKEREKNLDEFLRLLKVMARRNGIATHSEEYYRKMLNSLPAENVGLYLAEYQKEIIAANLVVFFQQAAFYLHGASDDRYRNVMAPFLLQWQQIIDAKERGCQQYDFGGVAIKQKRKSWEGITRFKTGFSPQTESLLFPGTFDLVINRKKYWLYEKLRKMRGLAA